MSYNTIIKYRNLWMGLAILWIILFHSRFDLLIGDNLKRIGYGGVDIFFFASGIGCYHSLIKNPDNFHFIKRRILRILPTYYTFLFFWLIFKVFFSNITLREILGNIFCVGWFLKLDNQFNWYINGIWLFYFLSPFFVAYVKQKTVKINHLFLFMILLALNIPFINTYWLILSSRLPIFFLGILFASKCSQKGYLTLKHFIVADISTIIGFTILFFCISQCSDYLWSHGLWWFPFILIIPGLCLTLSFISEYLKNKLAITIGHILSYIGEFTFELYLTHIFIFDIIDHLISSDFLQDTNFCWLTGVVFVLIFTFLLHKCVKTMTLFIQKFFLKA